MSIKNRIPGGNELLNAQDLIQNKLNVAYGSKLADLGCGGAGFFVMASAQVIGPEGKVYAVDVVRSVLNDLESKAKLLGIENIKTVWSDLEKYGATKINDESMNYTLLINVLFQNKKHLDILKEAMRLTKKGGKILVVDWREGRFPVGPNPANKISAEQVKLLAQTLNLRLEQEFNAGKFHYGLIFVKQ